MSVRATVLIPTHDHGPTLNSSIPTALDQTVSDIEVFVIGDGVPDVTRSIVRELARTDDRVRFFDHPKGQRHGETYRHTALQEARGDIVCYLSDDDLWLPDHVESLLELLAEADFAHACPTRLEDDGSLWIYPGDLAIPYWRSEVLAGRNFIPLSMGAHTMDMYRRLPLGWRTTPRGTPTDLYMWQQFLSDPSCRAVSGSRPTVLNFPASLRPQATAAERAEELQAWSARRDDPAWRNGYRALVSDFLYRERARLAAELDERMAELARAYGTATWRMRSRLLEIPGVGRLARRRRGEPSA
jgi:glycosyltransferase involved in cell wall biosynthesis